ncbi:MAG: type I-E CRISPR-associated protein Cas6/Cse3/CasE [Eubacteriales bacterium]|nr:type I-E CRISPR-associated protein Cas6/Cse3/CasE [Eubacteriales bacterium]
MYLTRIELDTGRRSTMKALTNPNLLHGAVEAAFAQPRSHALWRIDRFQGRYYLMLLSENKPDCTAITTQFGCHDIDPETRDYAALLHRIVPGSKWHFRLVANPTYSNGSEKSKGVRGAVHAHRTPAHQRSWLLRQSEKHGFSIQEDDFDVVKNQWFQFYKAKNRKITLLSVTYEGILTVTDPDAFRNLLCHGIGRGKAYGQGLLTLVSCHG